MPQSLTDFDAALKDDYGPGLRNAVNNSNPIFTEAMRNDEDIVGRQAVWSLHSSRSSSTAARAEYGALPRGDRQRYNQLREDLAFLYHTIEVSGPAKHLTRNDTGAFARALESEMKGAEIDLKNDVARQVFGQALTDGTNLQSGVLGVLTADPGTGTTLTFANSDPSEMRYFFSGEEIAFINPADGTTRAGGTRVVSTVDRAAKTVTVTAAIDAAVASGDYVVRAAGGTSPVTNFGREINGLRHLINATSIFANVNPSSVPSWAALSVGSTTTGISEVLIEQAAEAVETDGNGMSPELYIVEHAQRTKLASVLQAQKRYEGREVTLKAGWRGLQIARGVLLADRFCPTSYGFAISRSELVRFVGLDFTWDDDDGRILMKSRDRADAVEASFKAYLNMVTTTRNAHAVFRMSVPSY